MTKKNKSAQQTFLTAQEVSKRYGVRVETVYAWKCARRIPFVETPGRRTVYRLADLEAWEEAHSYERTE